MNPKIAPLALVVLLMACKGETQLFHHGGDPLPPDPAPQASDLTVDQLIAKYVAARGGDQKLKALQTVKMTGTWEAAEASAPITLWIAPGRYARKTAQGATVISWNVVDGQTGWELNPRVGVNQPKPMSAKDTARFRRLANPQGPLFDAKAKGNKVEVVGKQPLKDVQVYKLKVTAADGAVSYYYLDAKTFLPHRILGSQYVPQLDKNIDMEWIYGDYRDAGGVKFPFREKANAPEANYSQAITWDKVELNLPVDETAFKQP